MRLTLDASRSTDLVVADDGSTVSGEAVPWNVVGRTQAGAVVFDPGSIGWDSPEPVPFCLDHDQTRPIGVLVGLVDDDTALRFTAALDPVPAAEHARAQMRSRSRSGVSVSVDVDRHTVEPDGTIRVHASQLVELSSVVRPAFTSARVAASSPPTEGPPAMPDDLTVDAASRKKDETPDPTPPADAPAAVPSHMRNVTVAPSRPLPTVSALAAHLARTVRAGDASDSRDLLRLVEEGERQAIRAALADVTNTQTPPAGSWLAELDGFVRRGMPFVEAFTVRATDRWPVHQRQVKTYPVPGKQTAEKAQIASTPAEFEWVPVADETYAHGNDVSLQTIEDNGEQVLTDLFEVTAQTIGALIDADAIAAADAAAADGGTGVDLDTIGAALGKVVGAGLGGPVIVCAPDVWGTLWSLTSGGGPALARLSGLDMAPQVVADELVAAGTAYVGARAAFRTYLSAMPRLRAVEVGLLGLNIGTYRRAAFRVPHPGALVKVGPVV